MFVIFVSTVTFLTGLFIDDSKALSGKYDKDKGRLRVWLFGIARNQFRNLNRKQQRKEHLVADETENTPVLPSTTSTSSSVEYPSAKTR